MDDNSPSIPRGCGTKDDYYAFNGKLMLISLVILVGVCIIVAFFHSYARWVHRHRRNRLHRLSRHGAPRADYLVFDLGPTVPAGQDAPRKGLNRAVLKSLPTFFYDSAAHDRPLECSVCLSEFGDNELGRVLPTCNHRFHIDCIDLWFCSHSNCPLCRAPVKRVENPVATITPAVSDAGSSSRSLPVRDGDGDRPCGSPSSPQSGNGKNSEVTGLTLEIRTGNLDGGDSNGADQGRTMGRS